MKGKNFLIQKGIQGILIKKACGSGHGETKQESLEVALMQKRTTVGKNGKSWQLDSKDQGSNIHSVEEEPWSTTTFNLLGMWTKQRNCSVDDKTKRKNPTKGGETKDPSLANKETTLLSVWANILPWRESGGTLGKMKDTQPFPH